MINKHILFLLSILLLAACGNKADKGEHPPSSPATPAKPAGFQPATGDPLTGTKLRFDGYYKHTMGNINYLMRFFEDGHVVLVNGPEEDGSELHKFLVKDTQGNPGIGLHNVPVNLRNDSLFFVTKPGSGEIFYSGVVLMPEAVRFMKYSNITGKRAVQDYGFTQLGGS